MGDEEGNLKFPAKKDLVQRDFHSWLNLNATKNTLINDLLAFRRENLNLKKLTNFKKTTILKKVSL